MQEQAEKNFQLLDPDTSIAADISQWQMLHNTNVNQYKSPHIPEVQNWKSIAYTDGSAMQDETSKHQISFTSIVTPITGTDYSKCHHYRSGGQQPHAHHQ
jgi:hypothetical protein